MRRCVAGMFLKKSQPKVHLKYITVVLQFVGPTLSGTSLFVGPGFGSTLVLARILILSKIIKYVVHTY
jgi:hypothetical protein